MNQMTYRELQEALKFCRDRLGMTLNCKLTAKAEVLEAEYRRLHPPRPAAPTPAPVKIAAARRRKFAAAAIAKFGTRRRQPRRDHSRGFGLDSGITQAVIALQAAMARTDAALAEIGAIADEIRARRAA